MITWKTLDSLEQLDNIQDDSFNGTQVIFKHSTTCPISHMAKGRLDTGWDIDDISLYYLDLKAYRAVSNAIAEKWGVEHQSPQIILIKDGKAIFDESHLDINVSDIAQSLS